MEPYWNELMAGLPDSAEMARVVVRMLVAAFLGALVGIQRERAGKPAGVRTHMLVSMGGALFVISCLEWGMDSADMSRVIQGLVTGIGFIGGGAILKQGSDVRGVATAASIWATGAIGGAVAFARFEVAILISIVTFLTLRLMSPIKKEINSDDVGDETGSSS